MHLQLYKPASKFRDEHEVEKQEDVLKFSSSGVGLLILGKNFNVNHLFFVVRMVSLDVLVWTCGIMEIIKSNILEGNYSFLIFWPPFVEMRCLDGKRLFDTL